MAHSSCYQELCPVHRGLIAMSGSSGGIYFNCRIRSCSNCRSGSCWGSASAFTHAGPVAKNDPKSPHNRESRQLHLAGDPSTKNITVAVSDRACGEPAFGNFSQKMPVKLWNCEKFGANPAPSTPAPITASQSHRLSDAISCHSAPFSASKAVKTRSKNDLSGYGYGPVRTSPYPTPSPHGEL